MSARVCQSQLHRYEDKLDALTDTEMTVIVDGFDEDEMLYFGRSYMDAPEIDTVVEYSVRITNASIGYDQTVNLKVTVPAAIKK